MQVLATYTGASVNLDLSGVQVFVYINQNTWSMDCTFRNTIIKYKLRLLENVTVTYLTTTPPAFAFLTKRFLSIKALLQFKGTNTDLIKPVSMISFTWQA